MADEFEQVKPSDVTFLDKLKEPKYSAVFKVSIRGRLCVMKVVCSLSTISKPC